MALLGLNAAARATGKAKSTILRHVEKGRLSVTVDDTGARVFDTSELIRAYGSLRDSGSPPPPPPKSAAGQPAGRSAAIVDAGEVEALRRHVEQLQADVARLRADLERERADRQRWEARYDQLAARTLYRLPAPETATPPTRPPPLAEAAGWIAGEVRGFVDLLRGRPLNRP